jgi:membrane-associated protease RseP (regulator of RpoE activity)
VFSAAGIDNFVLDLRSAPAEGPVRQWLDAPQPMRMAGAVFDPDNEDTKYYRPIRLGKAFDALVFTGRTTRAVPLATLSHASMMPGGGAPPRVRLGVQMQQKGEDDADQPGVKILALMPGHAAEAAGLRAGDRILKIGDDDINELPDVYPALRKYDVDQVARVTIVREGQEQAIDVKMIKPRTTAAAGGRAATRPS